MTPALAAYLQAVEDEMNVARCLMHNTKLVRLVRDAHAALEEARRQMTYPGIPPVFAVTVRRMIDEALARAEVIVKEGG